MEKLIFENFDITKSVNCFRLKTGKGNYVCQPRKHHGFAFFLCGKNEYGYGEKILTAKKYSFLYLPKNVSYTIRRLAESELLVIDFETAQSNLFSPYAQDIQGDEIKNCFLRSLSSFRRDGQAADAAVKSNLYQIVSVLQKNEISSSYKPVSSYLIIAPAVDYIREHFTEDDLTNENLSELCKISVRYFSELFSFHMKQSPKQYILSLRLQLACELLCSENFSISDVALNCGFQNIYYFSRLFKEKIGVSPIAYRRFKEKA